MSLTVYNGVETDYAVERKITGVDCNIMCSYHLHSTMEQNKMMCGSEVERNIKTTGVHSNIKISVQLSLTLYNGADRRCISVKWRGR